VAQSPSCRDAKQGQHTHSMEHLVMQSQLRWIGHVIRMKSNRLPRRILYSELQHGLRAPSGQKKRFSDHVKAILKKCLIPPDQLETLASDRVACKDVWGGSDGFRHLLRPGGRSTSCSSTHDHKHSSIRSSMSYLWQNLRVRIRAPESSSFSPSVS